MNFYTSRLFGVAKWLHAHALETTPSTLNTNFENGSVTETS